MPSGRLTIFKAASAEITEKKSRFIGAVSHAENETEAQAFLASQTKLYYDARHHCSAFLTGNEPETVRASDDGEPGGTAGRPILTVLQKAGLHDAICVVTRYFGGTLLGTGGLVRAYTEAAQAALSAAVLIEKFPGLEVSVTVDYPSDGKLKYEFAERKIPVLQTDYGAAVTTRLLVPEEECEGLLRRITDITGGRAQIVKEKKLEYGLSRGKLILPEDL